ncbi:LPS export ABC transporter periplasmic protein LptC [Mucilaginibacter sp.]|uniref:LPS export ABC transporter periplasmic protein LptC n=1 Tax=Mucilaginibacter sp. TaxID=1882438 RepID=UPI002C475944|nr:LPS export ABC transporter periplasmic protein LptC [Mucilaginibacter sp.]HTI59652.1 LPS export ABC transporter periplasmic protein LptC [Mucilaginibacter sp.]
MKKAGLLPGLFLTVIIAATMVVTGCENDLKDLKKISANEATKPVQRYTNVDVIWSDSAKVKAHMTSPLMLDYTKVAKPYTEMPKGVKVIFYDANLQQTCTITSEYAIRHVAEKVIELRKNVVGTNVKGETFHSDELIWDENTRQIHSDKPVHVQMTDGSILDGLNFVSDEGLNHWKFGPSTGIIHVDSKQIGQ